MSALRFFQRGAERRPRLGEFRVELLHRAARRHTCLLHRRLVSGLGIHGGLVRLAHRRVKLRRVLRERAHALAHRAQRIERLHAPHLKSRRRDRDLQRSRLRLAAFQIRRHELHREQVARLHARLEKIPLVLDARLLARRGHEHRFLPAAGIDLHEPRDFRKGEIVRCAAAEVHEFVCGENKIVLRLLEFHRGQQVGHRADFIFRAELVFKSRLRAREMHAVAAARVHRDFSREQSVRARGERHTAARLALLDEQFRVLHGLVRLQLQLDLCAFERDEGALLFRHRALRQFAIFRIAKRLLKFRDVRPLARIQQILPRERVARLDAVAHARAAHLHGRGETVAAERFHVHHLPAAAVFSVAHRLDARAVRRLAYEFDHHAHRVALRDDAVPALGLVHDHLCPRDALEICAGKKRAQEQRVKAPPARSHHHNHRDADGHRTADGAPDQLHGQQRTDFHGTHAPGDIRLQQRAELLRVKNLAGRPAEFHRREQVLAQPRLRVFDQPRKLPLIRRVQQLPQTLPPHDHQHRGVRDAAQRPAQPVGQHPFQIHDGHREHRQQQHRDGREHALDDDQPASALRKGAEL